MMKKAEKLWVQGGTEATGDAIGCSGLLTSLAGLDLIFKLINLFHAKHSKESYLPWQSNHSQLLALEVHTTIPVSR